MQIADHLAVLRRDGVRLADAAQRAGLDAVIPTCPGWQVRDLLAHLGGVHRWAASFVTGGRVTPYDPREQAAFFPAVADEALPDWYRTGHTALVDALEHADESLSCWTFLPATSPLAFWARRQAHETAVHRADAESAIAAVPEWDAAFAADGIDELLNAFFSRPGGRLVADPPVSLTVALTDTDAAWSVHIGPDARRVVAGRHAADLTVAGPARDVYLLLWNRGHADGLDIRGDRRVLELWRERARVSWR
jgi:uncharacterized protein (TIGR03083 family)